MNGYLTSAEAAEARKVLGVALVEDLQKVPYLNLPTCNFCNEVAEFDSPVKDAGGTWAFFCSRHYGTLALHVGYGFHLVAIEVEGLATCDLCGESTDHNHNADEYSSQSVRAETGVCQKCGSEDEWLATCSECGEK